MNKDEICLQGVAAAWQEIGAECNHYTAACWGLAAVMKAAGRDVKIMDVANRWHYPLAGADQNSAFAKWLPILVGACEGMEKPDRLPYDVRALLEGGASGIFNKLYDARNACTSATSNEVIEKQTAELIDREIKRAYPKTRRNTKRYRELADSVRDKARKMIVDELREAAQAKLSELAAYVAREHGKLCRTVGEHIGHLEERVADLLALAPDSKTAAAIQGLADRLRSRLTERQQYTAAELAELEAMLAPTDSPMVAAYKAAKAAAPEAVAIFKAGAYCQAYFEDARLVCELLTIDLEEGELPYCQIPIGQIDYVIKTIVKYGHRVAVCEQVAEAPKGAKTERIVGAGQLVEDVA